MNVNPVEFFKTLLHEISTHTSVKNMTVFEYFDEWFLIGSVVRIRGDVIFEHTEYISIKENEKFYEALAKKEPIVSKKGRIVFVYIPFEVFSAASGVSKRYFLRIERFDGKRFSKREMKKVIRFINESIERYKHCEFENLKMVYQKGISISLALGDIFGRSIRESDAFKFMIRRLEDVFGFDRIRMYIVDEARNLLKGIYSAYRTGFISDISHELLPLTRGTSSLVDVLLDGSDIVVKDQMAYIPLRIDYRNKGLIAVDNLLSRIDIKTHHLDILKSFSSLMAIAFENVLLFEKIQEMSLYDDLTGLALRRYFNQKFQEEFYRAERFSHNLSVIWIDIDYFKEINDSFGHQIGDVVLGEIANTIKKTVRKIDFPARYGGDEIVILLPQSSEVEAMKLAKRLLEGIRGIRIDLSPFGIDKRIELSVSMGIASYPNDAKTMEELMSKADEALYWVKSHGRNGVISYTMMKRLQEKDANRT